MAVKSAQDVERLRQEKRAQEKRATLTFTGLLLLAFAAFGLWITCYTPDSQAAKLTSAEGDTKKISNVFMAGSLCKEQAAINYQGKVVNAVTDDFSSRYDEPRDLFIILMRVSVKDDQDLTTDYQVYCHVVPDDTVVSYMIGFEIKG